jgi:hypothetical protein
MPVDPQRALERLEGETIPILTLRHAAKAEN